jgi:hypothetical protein
MSPEAWSALASGVGIIVAVIAIVVESRRSRFVSGVELIMKLDEKFESNEFRRRRARAAEHLKSDFKDGMEGQVALEDVLNFFEMLGFFHRKGAVDSETVWHTFGTWVVSYYALSRDYIALCRQEDVAWYRELTSLYEATKAFDQTERRHELASLAVSETDLAVFLAGELALADRTSRSTTAAV